LGALEIPSIFLVFQAAGEMIEMPVADPCNLPANGDRSDTLSARSIALELIVLMFGMKSSSYLMMYSLIFKQRGTCN